VHRREEATGGWKKLHKEELHNLYFPPDIVRRIRWQRDIGRTGEMRSAYKILIGKSEGKRLLGRPKRRWEDNIRMDLRECGLDSYGSG
jgi:hypothetical protein